MFQYELLFCVQDPDDSVCVMYVKVRTHLILMIMIIDPCPQAHIWDYFINSSTTMYHGVEKCFPWEEKLVIVMT